MYGDLGCGGLGREKEGRWAEEGGGRDWVAAVEEGRFEKDVIGIWRQRQTGRPANTVFKKDDCFILALSSMFVSRSVLPARRVRGLNAPANLFCSASVATHIKDSFDPEYGSPLINCLFYALCQSSRSLCTHGTSKFSIGDTSNAAKAQCGRCNTP